MLKIDKITGYEDEFLIEGDRINVPGHGSQLITHVCSKRPHPDVDIFRSDFVLRNGMVLTRLEVWEDGCKWSPFTIIRSPEVKRTPAPKFKHNPFACLAQ